MRHLKVAVFVAVFLLCVVSARASIFYEMLPNNILHFNNSFDNYYINMSSGMQFTNVYPDWWTRNVWCIWYVRGTLSNTVCNDKLPMSMSIQSDNSTFINVSGSRDVVIGSGQNVRFLTFNLTYSLGENDSNMSIDNVVSNTGKNNLSGQTGFSWIIKDIKIGNSTSNNVLFVNKSYFDLSHPFKNNYSSVDPQKIFLFNTENNDALWVSWENANYTVNTSNVNESLNINLGDILGGETKRMRFNWMDAVCTWTTSMSSPTSDPNITINGGFLMNVTTSISGTCPISGRHTALYNNGTVFRGITGTNLSTTQDNPYLFTVGLDENVSFPVTGLTAGVYPIMFSSSFNGSVHNTSVVNVTVNALPVGANCSYTNLSASQTLSSNQNGVCYDLQASNMRLNCNFFVVNGAPFSQPMIKSTNKVNVSIVNCIMNNTLQGIFLSNVTNIAIANDTLQNLNLNFGSAVYLYALFLNNTSSSNSKNVTMKNMNANLTTIDCLLGEGYAVNESQSNLTNLSIVTMLNVTQKTYFDGQPEVTGCQASPINVTSCLNFANIDGFSVFNATCNQTWVNVLEMQSAKNGNISHLLSDGFYTSYPISLTSMNNFTVKNVTTYAAFGSIDVENSANFTLTDLLFKGSSSFAQWKSQILTCYNFDVQNLTSTMQQQVVLQSVNNFTFKNYTALNQNTTLGSSTGYVRCQACSNATLQFLNFSGISVNDSNTNVGALTLISPIDVYLDNSTFSNVNGSGLVLATCNTGSVSIANSTITNTSVADVRNVGCSNATLYDVSYNKSKMSFSNTGKQYNVSVQYSFKINTSNQTGGVLGANVSLYDTNKVLRMNFYNEGTSGLKYLAEFMQWGTSTYTSPCANTSTLDCYSPYNATAANTSVVTNSTLFNLSSPYGVYNITIYFCIPPSTGLWSLGYLCIDQGRFFNLTGRELVITKAGELRLIDASLTVQNMTRSGNMSVERSNVTRGLR